MRTEAFPVAAIVLAAGASLRLGMPKQMVRLEGETLLARSVRVALEAGLRPVFGIVSPDLIVDRLPAGMTCVVNHEAAEGMASSIRSGLRALVRDGTSVPGAIILPCDQPAVTTDHLRQLAAGGNEVIASTYARRNGIPAYFPNTTFASLLELRGDTGARDLLRDVTTIPLLNGELDVDTIEDLYRARELYETKAAATPPPAEEASLE